MKAVKLELLKDFGAEHRLDNDELRVLSLLARRVLASEVMASELGLDPVTVRSQLLSLFQKTRTASKSGVLMALLLFSVRKIGHCQGLSQRPAVLIMDDGAETFLALEEDLGLRGLNVHRIDSAEGITDDWLLHLRLDALIGHTHIKNGEAVRLLKAVQKAYRYFPSVHLVVNGFITDKLTELQKQGVVQLVSAPIESDKLFLKIFERYVRDVHERNRYFRVEDEIPALINGQHSLQISNLSCGGAFIPYEEMEERAFAVGDELSCKFRLNNFEQSLRATGQVVWRRQARPGAGASGIGVRFVGLSESERGVLQDYIRLHKVLHYLPQVTP